MNRLLAFLIFLFILMKGILTKKISKQCLGANYEAKPSDENQLKEKKNV